MSATARRRSSFPGRAYVLPRAADAALPVETVNLERGAADRLRRVSDRNLLRAMQEGYFGRPLDGYLAGRRYAANPRAG